MVILCRRSYCGVSIRLLALIVTIEERHDLGSRAVVAGAEQSAADAAGDAVLGGPCHRVGVIGIGSNINRLTVLANMDKVQVIGLDKAAQVLSEVSAALRAVMEGR